VRLNLVYGWRGAGSRRSWSRCRPAISSARLGPLPRGRSTSVDGLRRRVIGCLLARQTRKTHLGRLSRVRDGHPAGVPFGLKVLVAAVVFWLVVILLVRVVPVVRRGRVVVLDRPKPCSMEEAQRALDRLVDAGFDAEIVVDDDNGLNMWANVKAATSVRPDERYVLQVPRKQARAANQV
jgi:hypothetical protein